MVLSRTLTRWLGLSCVALCLAAATSPTARVMKADEPSLHDLMVGLKSNLKVLTGALQSPQNDEAALSALSEMQIITIAAKLGSPPNLKDIDERRRAAHSKAFRVTMAKLLQELAAIEIHVLEGQYNEAFGLIRNGLFELREAAHEKVQ